jgi:C-terminal processing protease CtpA/Prc
MRADVGADRSSFVDMTLQSFDGDKRIEHRLKTSTKRLPSGKIILGDSRILEGNIGYLRIPSMSNSNIENVLSYMETFRDTGGLIIDVRGNTGGYYEVLRALYGYFIAENTPPYVTNIAAYRQSSRFKRDHLHDRPTYRLNYSGWTRAERKAINKAIAGFKPEWQLPRWKFSAWHFMLLGRSGNARQYHYQKPVAVLSNSASFSATDGFLSAFSDLPGVILIGEASAGGSGATQHFSLPNSGIEITLSSMASFRPNGKLFDGNGIEVDIPVMPTPDDFLGRSDTVIDRAIKWIKQASEQND